MRHSLCMKKFIITLMIITILIPIFSSVSFASELYTIPLATEVPRVDGNGGDNAWKNALQIKLSPSDCLEKGYVLNSKKLTNGVSGGVAYVVWYNKGREAGLYFKWDIDDPTQSYALDTMTALPNSMDCVQVFLDPLNKKKTYSKEIALCFTFTPYSSSAGSGIGEVPDLDPDTYMAKAPIWWEHWVYACKDESIGVKLASVCKATLDNDGKEPDHKFLIYGYIIEAFIPFSAMQDSNGNIPETVIPGETKMGMGLSLLDYEFDYSKYLESGKKPDAGQSISNVSTEFDHGVSGIAYIGSRPMKYNTIILGGADKVQVFTEADSSTETEFNALAKLIMEMDSTITSGNYSEQSVAILRVAVDNAKRLESGSSSELIKSAITVLNDAFKALTTTQTTSLAEQILLAESLIKIYAGGLEKPCAEYIWDDFIFAYDAAKTATVSNDIDSETARCNLLNSMDLVLTESTIDISSDDNFATAKEYLYQCIDNKKNLEEGKFTSETWVPFSIALNNAKVVYEDQSATLEEIAVATATLKNTSLELQQNETKDDEVVEQFQWGVFWIILIVSVFILLTLFVLLILRRKKMRKNLINTRND